MSDTAEEIFLQDGVSIIQAEATYMQYMNIHGTLYITITASPNNRKFIEWKPNEVTVDSDAQDQEWTVVNTTQRRSRTISSSSAPIDNPNRIRSLKFNFDDFKSFRAYPHYHQFAFFNGKSEVICKFKFHHGDCERLVSTLRGMLHTIPSKRDKNLYTVIDQSSIEYQQIGRSFAELDISTEGNTVWRLMRNFKEQPLETTMETFAKVTDFVYRSPEQRELDELDREDLNKSITELENTISHSQGDYEVVATVPELPKRMDFPRLKPLNYPQWESQISRDGVVEDVESIKMLIFRGGVDPKIRETVWKYLLDYFPWDSTTEQRTILVEQKKIEYYTMKFQWETITKVQEDNFSDYRDRKSLIEKDVNRTDRNLDFYAGDNNPNLKTLNDILMTYVMYNFDLGYVQGMSDLLSPILQLLQNEAEAFWCFVGFMNKVSSNFDKSQADMLEQLRNLHTLLNFVDPELGSYLNNHESGNMFFCFRWLLVWFKRELSLDDVMRFWEVLWTGYPCANFLLLVSIAILCTEKQTLISNNNEFTHILKHVNELSGKLDMNEMLNKAEGIYYQIKEAEHLTDNIRFILGLPILRNNHSFENGDKNDFLDSAEIALTNGSLMESDRNSPEEIAFERSLNLNFT